ncbi:TRAP transporter substrate-binding protein [Marispirochaeta aestuarii]|uniref:TRAP transporter substrate-binding protein n=1 Tax=Marispirochaeta aestuarii TaxID=1963862 RepID=UPI002ABDB42E|nr:TRAP transporter substrate-binding protein [Marispirochaeta aestuarii]
MFKRLSVFLLIAFLALFTLTAEGNKEKSDGPVTLRLGHGIQLTHPAHLAAEKFAKSVEERTNGNVIIQIFPNRQLGEERDMVEGLQLGTVDMTIVSTGPLGGFAPEIGVVDLPFLFTSSEHAYNVLDGEIGRNIMKKFEPNGIVGLSFMENGWRSISTSDKKIVVPDDLKGMKIRTMENKVHMASFKAMGAAPVPMVWGEVYTSLQQGVIDGQENPPVILATNALWEVQKYYALTNHFYTPQAFLMSKKTSDSLPSEYMDIIMKAAQEATDYQRQLMAEQTSEYIATLKQNGMEVYDVDRSKFQQAAKAVYQEYESVFGKDLIDSIMAIGS